MTDSPSDRLRALAAELTDDSELCKLHEKLHRPNLFEATNIGRHEIRHSAFLAWLLTPTRPHGLEDRFLQSLVDKLLEESAAATDSFDRSDVDLTAVDVVRESEEDIDILIKTRDRHLVVCIENKIDSTAHSNQLDKYQRYVETTYGTTHDHRLFAYLTPRGQTPPDGQCERPQDWIPLSYGTVVELLVDLLKDLAADANLKDLPAEVYQRTKIYIEDFISLLTVEGIVEDPDLDKLVHLYAKYKDVFGKVADRYRVQRKQIVNELKRAYMSVLEEYVRDGQDGQGPQLVGPIDVKGMYISFHTQRMDTFLESSEFTEGDWTEQWGWPGNYQYLIYIHGDPVFLKPQLLLEVSKTGQQEHITEKMKALLYHKKNVGEPRGKRLKVYKDRVPDIEVTTSPSDIDFEDIKSNLKAAIESLLKWEKETLRSLQSAD